MKTAKGPTGLPIRTWSDVRKRVIGLYAAGWKHIQDGHSADIEDRGRYQTRIGDTLGSPMIGYMAAAKEDSGSTESRGYVGCNDSESLRSAFFLVFVQDVDDPLSGLGRDFVKSAYPASDIPAEAAISTNCWYMSANHHERQTECRARNRRRIKQAVQDHLGPTQLNSGGQ